MDSFKSFVEGLVSKPNMVPARQAAIQAAHVPTYMKGSGARVISTSMGLAALGGIVVSVGMLNLAFGKGKKE
ncbi:uncharacterized protein AMSG_01542 [Thecamonas trahens ATCC 50062]|uniref:Uncharacterized protein n=1 Tax=Thecamonas trahens ATCC 50062 TaxID=461836 RepID=A0A0L0DRQ3_THETB|nr:hypothetical protein AMSG_01542 [Thecamonas trahens ATCC 50062]KNC54691.1 hypothetical protein AMSG_01542 [Thecamonas trahens ATCC 50062]|eukprot:XP_013761593.1 hypothetical protein AMSG_01542 [Thecamonas trahens ATCC 50062]